jgi:hypothetical protein
VRRNEERPETGGSEDKTRHGFLLCLLVILCFCNNVMNILTTRSSRKKEKKVLFEPKF